MRTPEVTAPLLCKPRPRRFGDGSDHFAIFNKARTFPERASTREGTHMEFLAARFAVFGITFQFWMPIIVGAGALYILYLWKRGLVD